MDRHDGLSRRRLVGALGVSAATGLLAGCLDDGGDELDPTEDIDDAGNGDGDDGETGDGDDERNGESEENGEIGTVKLAVLEPFTGEFADLAAQRHRGTELAIQQVNESDEYGFEFEYSGYDTQLDVATAIQEADHALRSDGTEFYGVPRLGGAWSDATPATVRRLSSPTPSPTCSAVGSTPSCASRRSVSTTPSCPGPTDTDYWKPVPGQPRPVPQVPESLHRFCSRDSLQLQVLRLS